MRRDLSYPTALPHPASSDNTKARFAGLGGRFESSHGELLFLCPETSTPPAGSFIYEPRTIRSQTRKSQMSLVSPFNSVKENHHHNNNKCGPGSEIPPHNRQSGTGGKPLCKDCAKLNSEGK
jgi:hypothetical protein